MIIWLRRTLKFLLKFFLALVIFYAVARFIDVYTGSIIDGARAPYLQLPTSHSIVVRWQTLAAETGRVRFGLQADQLDRSASETEAATLHSVELDGLQPDTQYYFSIDPDSASVKSTHSDRSQPRWFRTLPLASAERATRLWVMGDSGDDGPMADAVRESAMAWIDSHPRPGLPDFDVWLALGDIAYTSGSDAQFQKGLFESYAQPLRDHPLWPVYGNHDDRRWTYFKIFTLPEHAEAGGLASGTENYYSFDYGQLHVVVLDSQDSSREPDGAMLTWLRQDLAQSKSRWRIAAFHHPPYSKGSHDSDRSSDSGGRMRDMRENVLPILEAGDVDLVLSGHSHMYERSYLLDCHYGTSKTFSRANIVSDGVEHTNHHFIKPLATQPHDGTVYVVAGSASKVDQGPVDHPAMPDSMLQAGSLVIDIVGDELTSRFINNKGEIKDQFTISKQAGYENGYQGCKK